MKIHINRTIVKNKIHRSYLLLIGLVLGIVFLSVLQISVSNMYTTQGIDLGNMQKQIAAYQQENLIIKEEIYTKSSLFTISQEANKQGFIAAKSDIFLPNTLPIAFR